jgi:Domain of unknown function (DUF4129)
VLVVGTLLLLVAVASRPGSQWGGDAPGLARASGHVVVDTLFYLFVVGEVLGLLLILWGLWPGARPPLGRLPRRRPWWQGPAGVLMLVTTTFLLVRLVMMRGGQGGGSALGRLGPPSPLAGRHAGQVGSGGVDWIAAALVALLLAALAMLAWRLLRPLPAGPAGRLAAVPERLLDDAIDAALAETDPRRAVIAAWERMEAVLAAAGLGRRDAETPHEVVARVLAEVELSSPSLRRMAELYEWARFSIHPVSPAMRRAALDALVGVRDEVRTMRASAPPEERALAR